MKKGNGETDAGWSQGITRRAVLKGMGYGLGAAAVAPGLVRNLFAATLQDQPEVLWSYQQPTGYLYSGNPTFYNGATILNSSASGTAKDTYQTILSAIDIQTQAVRWNATIPNVYVGTPTAANGGIYVFGANGTLYAFDADTGAQRWSKALGAAQGTVPVVFNNQIFFLASTPKLVALDLNGNEIWHIDLGGGFGANATPVVGGNAVAVLGETQLYAFSQDGSELWNSEDTFNQPRVVPGPSPYTFVQNTAPVISGGNVYVLVQNPLRLVAADLADGSLVFQSAPIQSANLSSPIAYNGTIYIGDDGGRLYAFDGNTGALAWQSTVGGALNTTPMYFDDGIVYFTAVNGTQAMLYAVDLQSRGTDILTWAPAGSQVYVAGVESGTCYCLVNGTTIEAVQLASIIHQFFAESELMADNYVLNGSTAIGSAPTFRTNIRLVDTNKNPRANKSIKVWASAPVTITSGGKQYSLDVSEANASTWLQTDALGELSITSPATDVQSPALYLWGNFMAADEAIVVYPDHDVITKLANVQGSDLQQAKTFDGTPMMPSGFSNFEGFATTIRGIVGSSGSSVAATQRAHRANRHRFLVPLTHDEPTPEQPPAEEPRGLRSSPPRATAGTYIAWPASTTNLLYQPVATVADRQYVPAGPPAWTAVFTGTDMTFTLGATLNALPGSGSIGKDVKHFVNDVVHGTEKVAKLIWNGAVVVVNDLYRFAVTTLEQALTTVTGIIKTVIGDIEKAIEWLSYLFDWADILSVKDQIKKQVNDGFHGLQSWLSAADSSVHSFFGMAESDVRSAFATVQQLLGTSTLQSKQQNGNDPQSLYALGGAKTYAKARWLIDKFRENVGGGHVGSGRRLVTPYGRRAGSLRFATVNGDPILDPFNSAVAAVTQTIENSFSGIGQTFDKIESRFQAMTTDPSQLVENTFGAILDLLSDVIVALMKFTDGIIEDIIGALESLVVAIVDLVNQPLDIPFVSDFYKVITGSQLSILDLSALFVAIPTTIVQRAISKATALHDAVAEAVALNKNVGYLFAAATYVILDPLMDLTESPLPMKFVYLALCILLQALNFPTDIATNTTPDYVFYAATAIPLIITAVDIRNTITGVEGFDPLAAMILSRWGMLMLGASVILAAKDSEFMGKLGLMLAQNVFTFIPFVAKPLSQGDEIEKAILVAIDAIGDASALGLAIAQIAI